MESINIKLKKGIDEITNNVTTYRKNKVYSINASRFDINVMDKIEDEQVKVVKVVNAPKSPKKPKSSKSKPKQKKQNITKRK